MSICVVGHSNPDTDSVTSAIAYAHFLKANGTDAKACMQISAEKLNPESKVVLEKFGLAAPEEITDAAGKDVALVDFSDVAQAPSNIEDANITVIGRYCEGLANDISGHKEISMGIILIG